VSAACFLLRLQPRRPHHNKSAAMIRQPNAMF